MELVRVKPPSMDWETSNLQGAWNFQEHTELIFKCPLKDKEEEIHITYLLFKIGEIYNTWTLTADNIKSLEFHYTKFLSHVQPKLNPVFLVISLIMKCRVHLPSSNLSLV